MMRQKIRLALVVAAAAAVTLSGCSTGGNTTTPSSSAPSSTAPAAPSGEISFAFWGGQQRVDRTQAVIDLYMKAFPAVKVTPTATGDFNAYWQQLTVQAAGNNMPCVPQTQNRTMADYGDRGALLALDDLVASGQIDVTNLPDSVVNSGRGADGKLYMIPYGAAFTSLMVDTTVIKDLGLPLPPAGYTWEWLSNWLGQIKDKTGKPAINVFGDVSDELEVWSRAHGENLYGQGGTLGLTAANVAAYWNYVMDLMNTGKSQTAQDRVEQQSLPIEQQPISQGVVPVMFWPANAVATVQKTLDSITPGHTIELFPVPADSKGVPGNALYLSGLSISKNCNNVTAAASFINFFLNDKDGALAFKSDNGVTTNKVNLQALLADANISPAMKQQMNLYNTLSGMNLPPSHYGKNMSQVFQINLQQAFQAVAFGQVTVEAGAAQYIADSKAILG